MTARAEGIIYANGQEVTVFYNNRAIANAEKEIGRGIVDVVGSFQSGGSISEMTVLLRHGMEASRRDQRVGGRPVSMVDAYRVMDEAGFTAVAMSVIEAVAEVLGYGETSTEDGEDPSTGSGQAPAGPDPNE